MTAARISMKRLLAATAIVSALLCVVVACAKREFAWFKPDPGEKVEYAITLRPRAASEFDLRTDKPLQLRLTTSASYELMEKHSSDFPVKLQHRKRIEFIATTKGAGGVLFLPEGSSIPLRLSNATEESLEIIVSSVPVSE